MICKPCYRRSIPLWLLVGMVLALNVKCSRAPQASPPNVLFIAVDDLKPLLGAYGDTRVLTPGIDRIAGRGTVFLNNHCQQAVCGPSRASLMTGLRPDHTGVRDLKTRMRDVHPDILSLPQHFRTHGYTTAAFGKIYDPRCVGPAYDSLSWSIPYIDNGKLPIPAGIDPPVFGHYQDPETRKAAAGLIREAELMGLTGYDITRHGLTVLKPVVEKADVPDNAYYDGIMVEAAMAEMEELANEDKPFFLGVGFKKPHLPFAAPSRYWDLYDRDEIELAHHREPSLNGPAVAYHRSGELRSYTGFDFIDDRIPDEQQREIIHAYYATISYVDALIGRLVSQLDSLGLADNTIIVLWGDHGWHLGDHNLWCKHSNFEQATRSPLIISAPGLSGDRKVRVPTEFIDIFPSLCELAGLELPPHLDGRSLKPLMEGEDEGIDRIAVSQFQRASDIMGYSIRTSRYRYTEWHENSYLSTGEYQEGNVMGRELYDYQSDPYERVNFAGESDYQDVLQDLSARMRSFLATQEIY